MTSPPVPRPSELRRDASIPPPLPSFPDVRERERERERQAMASFTGQATSNSFLVPPSVAVGARATLLLPPLPPPLGLGFASTSDPEHSPSFTNQQSSPLAAVRRGVTIPSDPSSKTNPFFGAFFDRAANGANSPPASAPLTSAASFLTGTPSSGSVLNSGTFGSFMNRPDAPTRAISSTVDAGVAANSKPVHIPPLPIEAVRLFACDQLQSRIDTLWRCGFLIAFVFVLHPRAGTPRYGGSFFESLLELRPNGDFHQRV
jgi:hypothetical protein